MSQRIRTFIGLSLPSEVKDALVETGRSLRSERSAHSIRWVKHENMHLTLLFLGDTDQEKVSALSQAVDKGIASIPPFQVTLGAFGCFPNRRRPRVFWVGFSEGADNLKRVNQALIDQVIPLGWQAEKRAYKPHLTLGYARNNVNMPPLQTDLPVKKISWEVTHCHLFRSRLTAAGPIYSQLHTSQF